MLSGQFSYEFLIGVGGFATQLMIEVCHAQNDSGLLANFQQQMQQRNRIRSPRHGHAMRSPGVKDVLLRKGLFRFSARLCFLRDCGAKKFCGETRFQHPLFFAHPGMLQGLTGDCVNDCGKSGGIM